ncbi:MAG: sulfotransferase domain-containing protein [Solirubrobacterales bacterium]
MGATVAASNLGVRFFFDRQSRVITPAHARVAPRSTHTWGLHGASFSIGPGEGVALIGPSGSGKTTLLRVISGVLPADEGKLDASGRVGSLLSIDAGLLPTLTGRENAILLAVLAGLSRAEARRRVDLVKAESRLRGAFERPASSFSQGMRARLALTAAEQADPEILLLDDVHEALDHEFRAVLVDRAHETIRRGGILIAAGHDHEMLARVCSRALLLSEGRVRVDGPFEEVRQLYLEGGGWSDGGEQGFQAPRALIRAAKKPALPNLIVIGGFKCGTTSLHHYLDLHPEIQMSRPKELNFFLADKNWGRGPEWYASHFAAAAPVRGESSPHYTIHPERPGVPERMRSIIPEAKLIYLVRDPIDRIVSQYIHGRTAGHYTKPLADYLQGPGMVWRSQYWMQLERYLEHFDASQIHLATGEELRDDREQTMRRIFRFLGVDEGFCSPAFGREWETSRGKDRKFRLLTRAARAPVLRRFDRLPERPRWLLERLAFAPVAGVERPELDDALREDLKEQFREDAARLREFAGRDFEGWCV